FGPDDKFLIPILDLLRRLPVYPLFGRGDTRLQPAYVEDVAEAVSRCMQAPRLDQTTFECAGPDTFTYVRLLEFVAAEAGLRPILLPVPYSAWHGIAFFAELLPTAPITRSQIELMAFDTIASPQMPGLRDLGIAPQAILPVLRSILGKAGQNSEAGPDEERGQTR